ncbi:MAG TPA: serine hydrolase domain-containing protein, partial [Spirochaetales bacterium]|nr:serine hydrolase domain-containing protein [Spirochaetales bacterium]
MSASGGRAGEEGAAAQGRAEGLGAGGFGEIARRALAEGLFAGLVLRVERNGGLLFEEAWGEAAASGALGPGSAPVAMATSTVFDLASVSKLFTTTAVLRLVTMGELGLGEDVRGLLSRCSRSLGLAPALLSRLSADLGRVDVAALLSHSSGIHYWFPFYAARAAADGAGRVAPDGAAAESAAARGAAPAGGAGFEEILASVLEAHPPEGKVVYSDLNFMLLGRLVEGATGLPLPEAVAALVLKPLGLKRTSYAPRRGPGPLGPCAATEFGNRIERGMVAALGLSFDAWR